MSWAATIGPTPGSSSGSGASARTCADVREDLALELGGFEGGRVDSTSEAA